MGLQESTRDLGERSGQKCRLGLSGGHSRHDRCTGLHRALGMVHSLTLTRRCITRSNAKHCQSISQIQISSSLEPLLLAAPSFTLTEPLQNIVICQTAFNRLPCIWGSLDQVDGGILPSTSSLSLPAMNDSRLHSQSPQITQHPLVLSLDCPCPMH